MHKQFLVTNNPNKLQMWTFTFPRKFVYMIFKNHKWNCNWHDISFSNGYSILYKKGTSFYEDRVLRGQSLKLAVMAKHFCLKDSMPSFIVCIVLPHHIAVKIPFFLFFIYKLSYYQLLDQISWNHIKLSL